MNIVVCVKHVPDAQSDRRFTPDGRVDRTRGDGTLNDFDENAIEAGLTVAADSCGHVTVLTMGPNDAEDAVRRGLQMGADDAVIVTDDALEGSDAFATALVLAEAIRKIGRRGEVDLVITGMASLDGLMSVIPALLAAELQIPAMTLAEELIVTGSTVRVRRELVHATETLETEAPALVSVTDRANSPRYPDFKGIMAARKKVVTTWSLEDLGIAASAVGQAGARTRILASAARPPRDNRVVITDDGDAGLRLAAYLVDNHVI